jgi:hypothetical protein
MLEEDMIRFSLALYLVAAGTGLGAGELGAQLTVTGWFSCDRCAPAARVKAERIHPSDRECAQKCVADGANLVFRDEKARRVVLRVANPSAAKRFTAYGEALITSEAVYDTRGFRKVWKLESPAGVV